MKYTAVFFMLASSFAMAGSARADVMCLSPNDVKSISSYSSADQALSAAVFNNNLELAAAALDGGAKPSNRIADSSNAPIWQVSIYCGHERLALMLINADKDLQANDVAYFSAGVDAVYEGVTGIWLAAGNGEENAIRLLLNKGGNPNLGIKFCKLNALGEVCQTGTVPLREAIPYPRVVHILLAHGADPCISNLLSGLPKTNNKSAKESIALLREAQREQCKR